ncbi:MAG: NUDIX hydrolase [Halobacteriaceae archaeon]
MPIADPRERYDDLRVTESRETLSPEEFAEAAGSEPARVGWVVLAFAFDDAGRVLLVEQPWADGWLAPGGVPRPGESLREAVVREVREETGVEISPTRPHAIDEYTAVDERSGETGGWTTVVFGARADTTAVADDPGLADEEITAVDWFDDLPAVFDPDVAEPAYRRCLESLY